LVLLLAHFDDGSCDHALQVRRHGCNGGTGSGNGDEEVAYLSDGCGAEDWGGDVGCLVRGELGGDGGCGAGVDGCGVDDDFVGKGAGCDD
jgi:hypothetical protein